MPDGPRTTRSRLAHHDEAESVAAENSAATSLQDLSQRKPLRLRSMTPFAVSLVMKPGPVGQAVVGITP